MPGDTLAQDDVQDADSHADDHERLLVLAAYGLYLLAIFNGVTLLIGAAMAWVRLRHARGAVAQSHYRNMLRVFRTVAIFAVVLIALTMVGMWDVIFTSVWSLYSWSPMHLPFWAMLAPLAALVSLVLGIWYLWRAGRGFVLALDEKPF